WLVVGGWDASILHPLEFFGFTPPSPSQRLFFHFPEIQSERSIKSIFTFLFFSFQLPVSAGKKV
ncbi:MAG: hypothetical protein Q4D62_13560, partial [Planctomycetia bacterium]|nr:hypothetical protein [Planctomycetia bacterium]